MGYQSLEAYVDHAMYDVCRVSRDRQGGYVLHALATQETAHIAAMVSAQKTKVKAKRPRPIRQPLQQWRPPQQQQQSNRGGRPGVPPMGGGRPYAGGGRGGAASMRMAPQSLQQQKQQLQQQQMRRMGNGGQPRNLRPVQQQQQQPQQQQQHRQQNWGNQPGSYNKQQPNRSNQQSSSPGSGGGGNKVELGLQKKQLETFCASKSISVEFKTVQMSNKKYVSTVIVGGNASDGGGGHRFKTYPNEFPSAAMAEDAASKAALDALPSAAKPSNNNSKAPLEASAKQPVVNGHAKMSNGSVETDLSQMLERVVSLVGDRTNGIWTTRIEVEYKERWKCDVPERWISAVIKDGRVEVDEPIQGRYIMKPSFKVQQKQDEKPAAHVMTSSGDAPANVKAAPVRSDPQQPNAPKITRPVANGSTPAAASAVTQPRPPPITYPKEDVWDVYITNVYSTVNVWLRFLNDEYQSSFDDLVTEMEL